MSVKVYVEGGGDRNKALKIECQRAFSKFFYESGLKDRMPAVVACGGRGRAYENFRTAHTKGAAGEHAILLVDSEETVRQANPWDHVRLRVGDGWQRPPGAADDQLHLMVQAMEAWFHADREKLNVYFGQGFRAQALSQRPDIETTPKADLIDGMARATRDCQQGEYSKGSHSFQILERIDPRRVRAASPHADRLLSVLDRVCTR